MALSILIWFAIFVIPFTNLSVAYKSVTITVLIVLGEVTFYLAVFLLGKTIWNKYKEKIKNWFTGMWLKIRSILRPEKYDKNPSPK